jgi:hypothetical protein
MDFFFLFLYFYGFILHGLCFFNAVIDFIRGICLLTFLTFFLLLLLYIGKPFWSYGFFDP